MSRFICKRASEDANIPAFVMHCVYETSHSSLLIESTDSMIMLDKASNMLPHWTESVDFNGAGFILIESTIFEIFGFFTCSSWFLHSIDAKYYFKVTIICVY